MDEQNTEVIAGSAQKLATAAEALERAISRLEAQQDALHAKVDRIVAALDEGRVDAVGEKTEPQAARERKTLSPLVSMLLSKNGIEDLQADGTALDKALRSLSLEQRIAVKAEMARAGIIE
jgi:hypothetical protein